MSDDTAMTANGEPKLETQEDRNVYAAQLAAQVIAGTLQVIPLVAKINEGSELEQTVRLNVSVPSIDDDAMIDQLKVSYYPSINFGTLDFPTQRFAKARASLEWLAVGPYEGWVPKSDKPYEARGGTMSIRPDFGKLRGRARVIALYGELERVIARFQ